MGTSQSTSWPGHSFNNPQGVRGGSSDPKPREDDQPPADSPPVWDPLRLSPSDTSIKTVQSQVIPQGAPIPSPLARLGDRETELNDMVDEMADSVRDLWYLCAHNDCPIRDEIPQGRPGKKGNRTISDNAVGFVAWIGRASAEEPDTMEVSGDEFGEAEDPPATNSIQYRWITRRSKVILEHPGAGPNLVATNKETLNINLSQTADGVSGHFITHSSQFLLTVNGIRIPTGTIAGPLPLFAVIEIGDLAAFWWGDLGGLNYLPRGSTTQAKSSRKRSRLEPEDEFDNFNDNDVPLAKKTKLLATPSKLGTLRRSARIAAGKTANSGRRTDSSSNALNNFRHWKSLPPRAPQNTESGYHPVSRTPLNTEFGRPQGPVPPTPPRNPPSIPKTGGKLGAQPPPTEKPHEDTRGVPPSNSPKTWNQQLQQRLKFWRGESKRAPASNRGGHSSSQAPADTPWQISSPGNLEDSAVILGIASVWRPLIDWGTSFAYGNQNHFQAARLEDPFMETDSVISSHPFIIPLIFNRRVNNPPGEGVNYIKPSRERPAKEPATETSPLEGAKDKPEREVPEQAKSGNGKTAERETAKRKTAEDPAKPAPKPRKGAWRGGVGHFVLAVAERIPHTKDRVHLRFWDSARGTVSGDIIRASVRNIVHNSSWMPPNVWPRFEETWSFSPSQTGNTCGLHVLLNAWAYMLNIPVRPDIKMRESFYRSALEIVNLALQGLMDATTIRAFLQVSGYAAPQNFLQVQQHEASTSPNEARQMRNLPQTARMNESIFNGVIEEIALLGAKQASAEEAQKPPSQESKNPAPEGPTERTPPPNGSKSPKSKSPTSKPPQSPKPPKDRSPPRNRSLPQSPKTPKARSPRKDRLSSKRPPREKRTSPRTGSSSRQGTNTLLQGTTSPPKQYTWEEVLENGLRQQRTAAKNSKKKASYSLSTVASNALDDMDAGYAIASVWAGLRNSRSYYGFGSPTTFSLYRNDTTGQNIGETAVGGPNHLIMPLAFSNDSALRSDLQHLSESAAQGKTVTLPSGSAIGGIGHFILAVARRQSRPPSNTVALYIFDSAPGIVSHLDAAVTAQNIVRFSGWMGVDELRTPLKVTPNFTAPSRQNVPHQRGLNNCGFHVILNAWAIMLGIQIVSSERRVETRWQGRTTSDAKFYRLGKEIMNLAMHGFMDSTTIQAFMMVFGYAQYQAPGVAQHAATLMNSVEMNGQILQTLLNDIRNEEARNAFSASRRVARSNMA